MTDESIKGFLKEWGPTIKTVAMALIYIAGVLCLMLVVTGVQEIRRAARDERQHKQRMEASTEVRYARQNALNIDRLASQMEELRKDMSALHYRIDELSEQIKELSHK